MDGTWIGMLSQRRVHITGVVLAIIYIVLTIVSCGNSGEDFDELLPREARPDLVFPTQEVEHRSADGVLVGELVERDDCLRVATSANIEYVIAWPRGYSWEIGGMGNDLFVVVRDDLSALAAKVGDAIRLNGSATTQEEIDGCNGPVWYAGETIEIVSARTDGLFSPTPTFEQMGSYALQFIQAEYAQDHSGQPEVVLSRALTPREVYDLIAEIDSPERFAHTQAGAGYCAGHPLPGSWYCDPSAAPFIVIVRGDWWTHGSPSMGLGQYLAVLIDRRADNPAPIMIGYLSSCNGAQFNSLLDSISLPDAEPKNGC